MIENKGTSIISDYINNLDAQAYLSTKINVLEKVRNGCGVLSNIVSLTGGILCCVGAGLSSASSLPSEGLSNGFDVGAYLMLGLGFTALVGGAVVTSKIDNIKDSLDGKIHKLVDRWNETIAKQDELESKTQAIQMRIEERYAEKPKDENLANEEGKLEEASRIEDEILEAVVFDGEEELDVASENVVEKDDSSSDIVKQILAN